MAESEREILEWPEFGEAARELARTVHESGFAADVVVAIARGGLLLAGAIDYVWRRTDRWIAFPWSSQAPVTV